ncbi:hypothetical protein J6590_099028 [Homalodisca vitripennis]|nr:hypothetical protein J6590_099028 [Homalodisca vitripennis]
MRKQQWRLGHAPCPLPSPLPHPPPPPRPPATTPQPMGEQQAPHLTRAMADERWRTVSWRMNKNLCLRRPVSEPGPLRMRDCRADHWTTETSCAWRRDMAVRAARGARRSTSPIITTQMCIPTALLPLSVTDAAWELREPRADH